MTTLNNTNYYDPSFMFPFDLFDQVWVKVEYPKTSEYGKQKHSFTIEKIEATEKVAKKALRKQ